MNLFQHHPQGGKSRAEPGQSGGGRRWPISFFALVRIGLGLVFIAASYDKILQPGAFSLAVFQYQLVPGPLINLVALILPWLELVIGICLLFGIFLPGSAVLSVLLMLIFIASLGFNQLRGLDVHCGCFSTDISEGPADLWTILRDVVFLGMACYVLYGVFTAQHSEIALNNEEERA